MKAKGYTLIEVSVALAIFAVITAIGVPWYTSYRNGVEIENVQSELISEVRSVKSTMLSVASDDQTENSEVSAPIAKGIYFENSKYSIYEFTLSGTSTVTSAVVKVVDLSGYQLTSETNNLANKGIIFTAPFGRSYLVDSDYFTDTDASSWAQQKFEESYYPQNSITIPQPKITIKNLSNNLTKDLKFNSGTGDISGS